MEFAEASRGPVLSPFFGPLRSADALASDGMTLVIAARASDGVVVVTDSRETINVQTGEHTDKATKLFRLPGVVVGFAGSGQWAEQILPQHSQELSHSNPFTVAEKLIDLLDTLHPRCPDIAWLVAGNEPTPDVVYFDRRQFGARMGARGWPAWTEPLRLRPGCAYAQVGVTQFTRAKLDQLTPLMTLRELVPICVDAVIQAAAATTFIGGRVQLEVIPTHETAWSQTDDAGLKRPLT